MFNIEKFKNHEDIQGGQFKERIAALKSKGIQTSCIESAVKEAAKNIREHQTRSFVIYGEPQSGKTEMMIALTAQLLDDHFKIIVHLLNDNVSLLKQNLDRFRKSGLAPAPVNFTDITDPSVEVKNRPFVIFCKKNSNDLNKLIDKIGKRDKLVVVDDEADYASPNSQINQGATSKINNLIEKLLGKSGIYIGVTATPARLDLNNTFENHHEKWVSFKPHDQYTGQEVFFPTSPERSFDLTLISDSAGDDPKYCREAFFNFLVRSAFLNLWPENNPGSEPNYTFLIHTSGKKVDHQKDFEEIQRLFSSLGDRNHKSFERHVERIWTIAKERFPSKEDEITHFVVGNILRNEIKVLNSDKDVLDKGTEPTCPFTVIIGGNIVSRGVTFDNLLAMFFTRDVKHKLQQDTYIQRARMFGSRGKYLNLFQLTIPSSLYLDWHKCFVFHRLSLNSIGSGNGAPVWLSDKRIAAVAGNSIDKANVSLDSGEMSFSLFDYEKEKNKIEAIIAGKDSVLGKISKLHKLLGEEVLPEYLIDFMKTSVGPEELEIMLHSSFSIVGSKKDTDQQNITRKKGFLGGANFTNNPSISHHVRILFNASGKGRVFYKYTAGINFLKNLKAYGPND